MKNLDAVYEKFTGAERTALVFEAMSRKDLNEADRLIDTCPSGNFRIPDPAYSERLRAVHIAALTARLMLEQARAQSMAVIAPLIFYTEKSDRASKKAFNEALARLESSDGKIRGIYFAWEEFCAEAMIHPIKTLEAVWGPVPDFYATGVAKQVLELEEMPDPDAETYKTALELFRRGVEMVDSRYGKLTAIKASRRI